MTSPVAPWPPTAGTYRTRLVRNGPWVPVLIWYGQPRDPDAGEELDRSPRWQALRNGEMVDPALVWPDCAGGEIDRAEYDYLVALNQWAMTHANHVPEAHPRQSINLRKIAPILPPRRVA